MGNGEEGTAAYLAAAAPVPSLHYSGNGKDISIDGNHVAFTRTAR